MIGILLTNCNCECEQSEAGQGVLEEIWPAGTQEGGTRTVVLAVVGGVEAEQMLAEMLCESGGSHVHSGSHVEGM